MIPGFHFTETMAGTYRPVREVAPARSIYFTLTASAFSCLQYLHDHKTAVAGRVTLDGFATDVALAGEMVINLVPGRVIRYDFSFQADDGKSYRLQGQKDISLFHLIGSLTELPATIVDSDGNLRFTAQLKFNLYDLPHFLTSFRLTP